MKKDIISIIEEIKKNLSGDYEKDMAYLHDMSEKYTEHPFSQEILREIATLMYGILPESDRNELNSRLAAMKEDEVLSFEAIKDMIKNGDFKRAKILMEEFLAKIDGLYEEEDDCIYLSLNHVAELYLNAYYNRPVKEVRQPEYPYNEYYRIYGYILTELGQYNSAIAAYETSLKWNGVDIDTIYALGEVYKRTGVLDKYLEVTKSAYNYACTRATMARYYRNLGFYYLEKYEPDIATALYVYSNIYYETENAANELAYIKSATGRDIPKYDLAMIQQILLSKGIELGPNPDTIGIIYRVGQLLMEDNDNERAKECFTIVYDITQDEECRELIEKL